jgi:hypothetical protein
VVEASPEAISCFEGIASSPYGLFATTWSWFISSKSGIAPDAVVSLSQTFPSSFVIRAVAGVFLRHRVAFEGANVSEDSIKEPSVMLRLPGVAQILQRHKLLAFKSMADSFNICVCCFVPNK